ncbi:hypothetical protein [Streptomyces chryseus]
MSVQDTYLGWRHLEHAPACKRPEWGVDVREDDYALRENYGGPGHGCPIDDCGHANRYTQTTVRIVCRSCGTAHVLDGENVQTTTTRTEHLGYGLPPRKVAGLHLWPAEPWLYFGRSASDEPHDFLVTSERVDRVTEADVVGQITQGRGKRGGIVWSAAAVPSPRGPYGDGRASGVAYAQLADGLRTVPAAAKWIAAQLAQKDTRQAGESTAASGCGGGHE